LAEEDIEVKVEAYLRRRGASQPVAKADLALAGGKWQGAEFPPLDPGAYQVTVTGSDVETVEDAFVVAEMAAQDL
jgi:hypothetical protein